MIKKRKKKRNECQGQEGGREGKKEKAGLIRRESRLEEVVRSNGIQHR